MSRLWDTPEFWVRTETDQLLHDYPDMTPRALAASLRRNLGNFYDDLEFGSGLVSELHRRADAGVRVWSGPAALPSDGTSDAAVESVQAVGDQRTGPAGSPLHHGGAA